jgi:hypothetical protein
MHDLAVIDGEVGYDLPISDSSENELAWRFFGLGNLMGMTATEIIAEVGKPTSRSSKANGQTLLQWQVTGYHMALVFNSEDQAVKVTSKSAHFAR